MLKGIKGFQKGNANPMKNPEIAKKISIIRKGKKLSEEHKRKLSESHKGKLGNNKGKHWKISEEGRRNMSLAKLGKKRGPMSLKGKWNLRNNAKGSVRSEAFKENVKQWQINNPNRKFKDTDIESKIETELKKRNINYQKQVPLCKIAIVDFYLPEDRVVIQCDGDYWHNKLKKREKDKLENKVLISNNFKIYRFWGKDIKKSAELCIKKVLNE